MAVELVKTAQLPQPSSDTKASAGKKSPDISFGDTLKKLTAANLDDTTSQNKKISATNKATSNSAAEGLAHLDALAEQSDLSKKKLLEALAKQFKRGEVSIKDINALDISQETKNTLKQWLTKLKADQKPSQALIDALAHIDDAELDKVISLAFSPDTFTQQSADQKLTLKADKTAESLSSKSSKKGHKSAALSLKGQKSKHLMQHLAAAQTGQSNASFNLDATQLLAQQNAQAGDFTAHALNQSQSGLGLEAAQNLGTIAPSNAFSATGQVAQTATNTPILTGQINAPVGTQQWQQALQEHTLKLTQVHNGRAHIALNPPELGHLRISLQMGEQTQIHFGVSNAQAKAAVESALPQLQQSLAESGIDLGQASVDDQGQFQQNQSQPGFGSKLSAQAEPDLSESDTAVDMATHILHGRTETGGIDLFA